MQWNANETAFNLAIRLSQLRSAVRVGLALAEKFPTEEAWEEELNKPEVQENLQAVAEIITDVQLDLDESTPEKALQNVENHYDRAAEALLPLCERYEIAPEDLLVVMAG